MADNTPDIFDLSDEEFDKLGPNSPQYQQMMAAGQVEDNPDPEHATEVTEPTDPADPTDTTQPADAPENEVTDPTSPTEPTDPADETFEGQPGTEPTDGSQEAEAGKAGKPATAAVPGAAKPEAGKSGEAKPNAEAAAVTEADYAGIGKRILAPFKANGRDIQVKSVDDAIQLMQMGANYNHKMAGLKPNLAMLKLLEKNELLDTEKINYLIDLYQKKPEAIAKLVKDSGIDPMDMDTSKDVLYSPTQRAVPEKEIQLEGVLDELKDSPHYTPMLDLVGKTWDESSRAAIMQAPQVLKVLNNHMVQGIYPRIADRVAYERSMGRLSGLNDVLAYQQIGDAMYAAGEFNDVFTPAAANKGVAPQQVTAAVAKPGLKEDPKTAARRKAVGSTTSGVTAQKQVINPLELSDAEFEKMDGLGYLNKQ